MKRNICCALAALGLSAAVAMPAEGAFDLLFDYSSPDGSAQAAPPRGPGETFWVRLNAVRNSDANNAVVGDMQFRFHYDNLKVDSTNLSAVTAGSSTFYAAAVSATSTTDTSFAGTNRRRTVLVSADPTDAPLSFSVGTNRGIAVGDIAPIAAIRLQTTGSFPLDVTEPTEFGLSADPTFPQIARSELAGVYTDIVGPSIDMSTFLSYDPANDRDGDGRPDSEEGDFVLEFPPGADGTNSLLFDTSADGISDGLSLMLGLDPLSNDTDGDGIIDGVELVLMQMGALDDNGNLFDPAVANVYTDTLGDGLPDLLGVVASVGNPNTNVDSDVGLDGASNAYEVATGYDPQDSSSTPPLGDVNNDDFLDLGDVLPIIDFAAGLAAPYTAAFPYPSRAGVSPADPAIGLDDALPILDYGAGLADQIR